jgi:hypothetical protein
VRSSQPGPGQPRSSGPVRSGPGHRPSAGTAPESRAADRRAAGPAPAAVPWGALWRVPGYPDCCGTGTGSGRRRRCPWLVRSAAARAATGGWADCSACWSGSRRVGRPGPPAAGTCPECSAKRRRAARLARAPGCGPVSIGCPEPDRWPDWPHGPGWSAALRPPATGRERVPAPVAPPVWLLQPVAPAGGERTGPARTVAAAWPGPVAGTAAAAHAAAARPDVCGRGDLPPLDFWPLGFRPPDFPPLDFPREFPDARRAAARAGASRAGGRVAAGRVAAVRGAAPASCWTASCRAGRPDRRRTDRRSPPSTCDDAATAGCSSAQGWSRADRRRQNGARRRSLLSSHSQSACPGRSGGQACAIPRSAVRLRRAIVRSIAQSDDSPVKYLYGVYAVAPTHLRQLGETCELSVV